MAEVKPAVWLRVKTITLTGAVVKMEAVKVMTGIDRRLGKMALERCVCVCVWVCVRLSFSVSACLHRCTIHTNEGSDLGLMMPLGREVKVVLHRVDHHRVSCVVTSLRRRDKRESGERGQAETQRGMRSLEAQRLLLHGAGRQDK